MRQRAYVARIPPLAIEPLFGFKCVTMLQVFHGVEGREELPEESARLLGAGWGSPCCVSHNQMSHITCHTSHVTVVEFFGTDHAGAPAGSEQGE